MGTTLSREGKINFILSAIKNSRATFIDKVTFIANAGVELSASDRTIKEIIKQLEIAGKIDTRIWK